MNFLTDALTGVTAAVGAEYLTLIIIVLTLILFAVDKLPMGFVAMLSAIVLGITGCMSLSKIYSGWSSSLVIMLIGMMIVGDAMFQTGAVLIIGRNIMRAKFASNERAVMAVIMLLSGALSAFLSNTAVVATFIPLIGAMVAASGGTLQQKHLMMPLGFAAAMGGTLTVIGSTSQPMVNTVLEGQGLELMPIFSIFPVAFPSFVFMIVYMVTVGYKMFPKVLDFEDQVPAVDSTAIEAVRPTYRTWISIGTLAFCVFGFFTGIWDTAVVALIGAAIVIITGCVDFKGAFKRVDWNTIAVMAFAQGIAAAMNDSGAGAMIANWVVDLVGDNLWLQMAGCVIVITVLTNIMSNTATAAMMAPIYILIASQLGVSYFPFMIAIAVATNLTASTPIGGTAVTMTSQAGYRFSDFVKIGTPMNIGWAIITIVMTLIVYPF
ncbi:SLC13 family permease [Intestinimonas timonensis]|uniref:SLC13 family permease n=1 Tax=Intestinimonas timonensis TaxID=1689270 RepID=UPI003A936269